MKMMGESSSYLHQPCYGYVDLLPSNEQAPESCNTVSEWTTSIYSFYSPQSGTLMDQRGPGCYEYGGSRDRGNEMQRPYLQEGASSETFIETPPPASPLESNFQTCTPSSFRDIDHQREGLDPQHDRPSSHSSSPPTRETTPGKNHSEPAPKPRRHKETHKMIEKKYRTRLNGHFEKLLSAMAKGSPPVMGEGMAGETGRRISKGKVLALAIEHIRGLELERAVLKEENHNLAQQLDQLKCSWPHSRDTMT